MSLDSLPSVSPLALTACVVLLLLATAVLVSLFLSHSRPLRREEERNENRVREGSWFTSVQDFGQLVHRVRSQESGLEAGWKLMMAKETGRYRYTAYKRDMPSGLTEYRTTTTVPNVSTHEFAEFLMDDNARRSWESFSRHASIIEQGDWVRHREQVVRWVRRFPFHFLTDREYVIANQLFALRPGSDEPLPLTKATPGCEFVACTRGLDDHHPNLPDSSGLIRVTSFNSSWHCRSVPWDSGSQAAEVVLLHSEDIRIPETLARFAVRVGMSGYVKEITDGLYAFVEDRRARGLSPDALDPTGYGHDFRQQQASSNRESSASGSSRRGGRVRELVRSINGQLDPRRACLSAVQMEAPQLCAHKLRQAASSVLPHQSKQRRELGAQLLEDEQSSHTNSHSRDARYRQRAPAGPIAEEPGGQTSTQHLPGDGLMSEQQLITQQCLSRRQEGLTRGVQTVSRILRRRKWWVWAVVTVVAVRAIKQGADEKQKGVGSDSRASAVERVARHEAQEANSGEESEAGEDLGSSEDASKAPDSSRTSLKDRVAYVFGL